MQDWSFVSISFILSSKGLNPVYNGWCDTKDIFHVRITMCLCAVINLTLGVDCSRFALSYPRNCPLIHTSCCNNSYWPPHRWLSARRVQQKDLSWQPLHRHTNTAASTCASTDKRQHTQSWGHQRVSWSMNNCSPRQQTPVQLSWGIVEISHRVTQFHHVSSFVFLLYRSPSSPAHCPEFTQIIVPILKFNCKENLTAKCWSPFNHK